MDLLYFIFFLIHIPTTLLIDRQAIWPNLFVPKTLRDIAHWWVNVSGDSLMGGSMGILGNDSELAWFKSVVYLEVYGPSSLLTLSVPPSDQTPPASRNYCSLFQVPVFVLGARGLWRDSPGIYSLLMLYGASACTATFACLAAFINIPTTSAATIAQKVISVTPQQRIMLLSSYVPFVIIPLCLAVDMALRLQKLASVGIRALESSKEK